MHAINDGSGCGAVVSSIRLPRQMRDDLKIQAIRAGRSFNAHVVMILQRALVDADDQA